MERHGRRTLNAAFVTSLDRTGFALMVRNGRWLIASGLCTLLIGCTTPEVNRDLSAAERRDDLRYLATEFADREQSFTPLTRAEFDRRVAAVESRVDSLSHDEFIAGIQWAVAAADNGHTEVLSHEHQRLRLPVDIEWFADGLYVVAVRPGFEELLGARIEAIEGSPPEDVARTLDAYSPGTPEHGRVTSGYFLERPELLAAIGVVPAPHAVALRFVSPDGTAVTRTLPAREAGSTAGADDALRVLDAVDPLPLYLRDPDESAFLAWLPEEDAVYIRINRNHDQALPEKLAIILDTIDARAPRNAIVDLRLNGGGNYQLTAPFAEALPGTLPDDGRLVLIIGPRTFSAGIVTAAILAARAQARVAVIGERAGDDLQFWAEGGFLTLPNSGLRVHYSDGYHDWRHGFDPDDERNRANPRIAAVNARHSAAAGSLDPNSVIPLTFRDYAAGRDPVMERALLVLGAPSR
jgi:hypothetical protein